MNDKVMVGIKLAPDLHQQLVDRAKELSLSKTGYMTWLLEMDLATKRSATDADVDTVVEGQPPNPTPIATLAATKKDLRDSLAEALVLILAMENRSASTEQAVFAVKNLFVTGAFAGEVM